MLRSLYSGISGLRSHQTMLDVTGNNIANVNTTGFKVSATQFQDTLSQMVQGAGGAQPDAGGTNPAQVGLGVKVAGITTNFEQGSAQNTGRSTDFMISGDGFFITQAGNEQLYTRAGSFSYDASGNLVTPDGALLQGWMANDGVVDANGPIRNLTVPFGDVMQPTETNTGAVVGNLSSAAANNTGVQTQMTMYDALGTAHQISLSFTKTGDNTWSVVARDEDENVLASTAGPLAFDPVAGTLPPAARTFQITPDASMAGSWPGQITIDLADLRQFGGPSGLTPARVDGNAMGSLQSISLSGDGTIMGVYSNNLREPIGKLALATFANPAGLAKAGNSSFRVGDNSGQPAIGEPAGGGRGSLIAGALEMSNVDLAEEFTGLIVAQRGFQANSRVITSSDEVLQDLVNLKR
jgi:flagellar hook protein FlgE